MTDFEWLDALIAEKLPQVEYTANEPMSRHTSFRIGGAAKRIAYPSNGSELTALLDAAEECKVRTLVIGNGTNLLVADEGIEALVIDTSRRLIKAELMAGDDTLIYAEAGVSLAALAVFAEKQGLTGLEFAHGIPGTVGGAVVMNAGAYDGEMKQVIEGASVRFAGGEQRFMSGEELDFSYRHSFLSDHPDAVVLYALCRLKKGDRTAIREKMDELMARRRASQPLDKPSAGSTFKRPAGYFAGPLIEKNGLKGASVGGAQVSEKHAGFVINTGGATAADVLTLIKKIQDTVCEKDGVRLETEVKIIR